jgi:hypothetical protein
MTMTTSPSRPVEVTGQSPETAGGARAHAPAPQRSGRRRLSRVRLPRRQIRLLAVVAVILAVLALAVPIGLSRLSSSAGSASEGSTAGVAPARSSDAAATAGGAAESPQAPSGSKAAAGSTLASAAATAPDETKIARTAWIGLQVSDLAGSAGRARIIASSAGGTVLSEDVVTALDPVDPANPQVGGARATTPDGIPTTDGGSGGGASMGTWSPVGLQQARLTLSVPADKLDGVLTQLSALGTVSYRSAQAQDVTATYVDTKARIEPARDSIERVRALMTKATDLQQLLVLEGELTRRQSDLDALTQQLADLDKRTTMSEVTVAMWTPAAASAQDGTGAAGGLRGVWDALLGSLTVVLTGLAVLLPWLLLVGLGGLIAWRVVRRRRATAGTAATSTTPSPATATAAVPVAGPSSADPPSTD